MKKQILVERFADNGAHSHYELIEAGNGGVIWSEAALGALSHWMPVKDFSGDFDSLGEFLGFNPLWIHPDFNPEGINMCFCNNGDWTVAQWCNDHDEYHTKNSNPELNGKMYKPIGAPTHIVNKPANPLQLIDGTKARAKFMGLVAQWNSFFDTVPTAATMDEMRAIVAEAEGLKEYHKEDIKKLIYQAYDYSPTFEIMPGVDPLIFP